jgi:hypothetical protein
MVRGQMTAVELAEHILFAQNLALAAFSAACAAC